MLSVDVDRRKIRAIEKALRSVPGGMRRAGKRAVRKTLVGIRTDAVRMVTGELALRSKDVRKQMKISRVEGGTFPSGKFWSTGQGGLPLVKFGARAIASRGKRRGGVSVKVKKKGRRKVLQNAFIATLKTGHKGIFQRSTAHLGEGRPAKETGISYGALPRKYRLPMHELYGPSYMDVLRNQLAQLTEKGAARLDKNTDHEVAYEIQKAMRRRA